MTPRTPTSRSPGESEASAPPRFADVLLIVNPTAGQGFAPRYGRRVKRLLERRGARVTTRETTGPDDAKIWAGGAAGEGFDLVCVLGGDGTMQQAVCGQARAEIKIPLAHISSGTANVIPLALALPWLPGPAVNTVLEGRVRDFDVGYLPALDRHFILMAAIGYPASIIQDSPRRWKNLFGIGTYAVAAIRNLFRSPTAVVTVSADDGRVVRRAHSVFLTNIGHLSEPRLRLSPNTNPHDGAFDVTVISSRTVWDVLVIVVRMLTWRGRGPGKLVHVQGSRVTVDARPALPVQIDGEMVGTTPLRAEILPRSVKLVVGPRYRAD